MEKIFNTVKQIRHEILEMDDYFKDADYELWMTYCDLMVTINNLYLMDNCTN